MPQVRERRSSRAASHATKSSRDCISADGQRVTVEVDKAFKVTGEEAGPHR
jgi:hypothetical protein